MKGLKQILAAEGLIKAAVANTQFTTDTGTTVSVPAMVVVKLVSQLAAERLITQAQRKDIAMGREPIPMRAVDRLKTPEAKTITDAHSKALRKLPKEKPVKEVDYRALSEKIVDKVYKAGYKAGLSLAGEWYVRDDTVDDPNDFDSAVESWATDSGDGWNMDLDSKTVQQAAEVVRNLPRYDQPNFGQIYSSGIHSGVIEAWNKIKANPKEYVRLLGIKNLPLGRQVKLRPQDEKQIHDLAWNGRMQQAVELLRSINS